jgi:hypothetical protein
MADNITIKDGGGTNVTLGSKDVGGVQYPQSTPVTPGGVTMVGTAGTASAGVMTIQGITSMTPIIVSDGSGALSVDDNGGSLTIDGSVSISGNAAVTIAAGAISTGATSIAENEDVASASADTGVKMLVIQRATPADTAADLDYSFPQMSAGRIWTASILPSGSVASGAFASGALASGSVASGAVASGAFASGALASGSIATGAIAAGAASIADNEDAGSSDGDRGVKMLVVRKAVPANTSGSDADYEFPQISAGSLWVASVATDKTLVAERTINGGAEYETVAASQTAQVLGATGGTGDYIAGVLVVPATTSPGNVLLLDNATSITIFTGGASSVTNLVPFFIPLGMISVSGAWKLTTGSMSPASASGTSPDEFLWLSLWRRGAYPMPQCLRRLALSVVRP